MPLDSVLIIIMLAVPGVLITFLIVINFERHIPDYMEDELLRRFTERVAPDVINRRVDFADLHKLPPPVERYLKHVLTDGQPLISIVKTKQSGKLRTKTSSHRWYDFTAKHLVTPITPGFVWGAKLGILPKIWLRVLDAHISGVATSKVDFLSTIPLSADSNVSELNSGALQRYLAEAAWYPTALLPGFGVEWSAIDNHSALATLTSGETKVSLEFRFNDKNEVAGIYTDSRYQRLNNSYCATPWEGHFSNYTRQSGMLIPSYGEVGWYNAGEWQCVWKADITNIKFNFYKTLPE